MRLLLSALAALALVCGPDGVLATSGPSWAPTPSPTMVPTSDLQEKAKLKAKMAAKKADKISKLIGGKTKSMVFRNAPRLAGSNDIRGDPKEYVIGLTSILAWGIIPAVLALLAGKCYCCCAHKLCCCCSMRCCRDTGKYNGGWGCFSIPCCFLWLALIATAAFCICGYIANGYFSDYFAGPDGMVQEVQFMMKATVDFAQGVDRTADNLNTVMESKCQVIQDDLYPSEFLDSGLATLRNAIEEMNAFYVENTNNIGSCGNCASLNASGLAALENIDVVQTYFDPLKDARDSIKTNLLENKDLVKNTTKSFGDKMAGTKQKMYDLERDYDEAIPQINDVDTYRGYIFLGIFAFPLLIFVISFCGLVTRVSIIFSCVTFLQWFVMFVLWILFGIQMIIGVGLTDACDNFMPSAANYTELIPSAGKMLQGCVDGSNLADIYDITDVFNYRQNVRMDNNDTINVTWPAVDSFVSDWNSSRTSMFTSCTGASCTADLREDVLLSINNISYMTINYSAAAVIFVDKLKDIKTNQIQEIFRLTKTLQNDTNCGYLGVSLRNVEEQLCDHLINAIGTMTVAIMVICIFSIPVIWSSIALRRRLKSKDQVSDSGEGETAMATSSTVRQGAFAV